MQEESDWLDGPRFVAWLEGKRPGIVYRDRYKKGDPAPYLPERALRRLRTYRAEGTYAYIYTVDAILISVGLALSEVPDELYVERPSKNGLGTTLPRAERQEAVRLYREGHSSEALATRYGVTPDSIRRWDQRERQRLGSG